jgi:quinol monooxygenase YgiN
MEDTMYCRVFEITTQPGKAPAALDILAEQITKAKATRGFLFVQALQSDDEILVVSSWRTTTDLRAYAESAMVQEMLTRLAPLLTGPPKIRSYDMKLAVEGGEGFFTRDEGGEG